MKPKELQKEDLEDTISITNRLLIYNSNHIWEDVVMQLNKATGFELPHCEQIAILAHTTGKAIVKSGSIEELITINNVLKEINLITEIE
jgi:ATP-dependent Clp protease adapter protein ClpS